MTLSILPVIKLYCTQIVFIFHLAVAELPIRHYFPERVSVLWPPSNGYLSFWIKRTNDDTYPEDRWIFRIVIPSIKNNPEIRLNKNTHTFKILQQGGSYLDQTLELNVYHHVLLRYFSPVYHGAVYYEIYFDGSLVKEKVVLKPPFVQSQEMNILMGGPLIPENILIKDFEYFAL